MVDRIKNLECELKMLRTSTCCLEEESKRKDDVLQQTTQAMSMVEHEHYKLVKVSNSYCVCTLAAKNLFTCHIYAYLTLQSVLKSQDYAMC